MWRSLFRDLKFGWRQLGRRPGFAVMAVLSLALGIGVNTAVFSVLDALFFRPIPAVENPKEIVAVQTRDRHNPTVIPPLSRDNFRDLRRQSDSYESLFSFVHVAAVIDLGDGARHSSVLAVTEEYFTGLGVEPLAGRLLTAEDLDAPIERPPLVLTHRFWRHGLESDPLILGGELKISGHPFQVVGVTPEGFDGTEALHHPIGFTTTAAIEALDPKIASMLSRRGLTHFTLGRLRDGVTVEAAQAEATRISGELETLYPEDNFGRSFELVSLREARVDPGLRKVVVRAGALVSAVVAFVLLIACANVANLLLARASSRRRELAVRQAVGATPGRIFRQMITESLLLAFIGGALGLLLAVWCTDVLQSITHAPEMALPMIDVGVDARMLAFAGGLSVLTAVLFGIVPAVRGTRGTLVPDLKLHNQVTGGRQPRLRRALVVFQVALSMVALVGAGLFVRSLQSAWEIDPGFDYDQTAAVTVALPGVGFTPVERDILHARIESAVESIPGVEQVSMAERPPMMPGIMRTTLREHEGEIAEHGPIFHVKSVGSDYFETLGIEMVRGATFETSEPTEGYLRAIVNETMASSFWPGEDAVGKRFRFIGFPISHEVVAVVSDAKVMTLGEEPTPQIYTDFNQARQPEITVVLRAGSPAAAAVAAREAVGALDPRLTVRVVPSLREVVDNSLFGARMAAGLLGSFAILALLLAGIGVYGLMSYIVGQSTREIGIRMALGAAPLQMVRALVKRSMGPVAVGVGLGVVLALPMTQLLEGLLYGVRPTDPPVYVVASALLIGVALLAAWLPARRATRIDPMEALRDR